MKKLTIVIVTLLLSFPIFSQGGFTVEKDSLSHQENLVWTQDLIKTTLPLPEKVSGIIWERCFNLTGLRTNVLPEQRLKIKYFLDGKQHQEIYLYNNKDEWIKEKSVSEQ